MNKICSCYTFSLEKESLILKRFATLIQPGKSIKKTTNVQKMQYTSMCDSMFFIVLKCFSYYLKMCQGTSQVDYMF